MDLYPIFDTQILFNTRYPTRSSFSTAVPTLFLALSIQQLFASISDRSFLEILRPSKRIHIIFGWSRLGNVTDLLLFRIIENTTHTAPTNHGWKYMLSGYFNNYQYYKHIHTYKCIYSLQFQHCKQTSLIAVNICCVEL